MISHMISCCVQDCVVLLAPYPNNPNPVESFNIKTDFDLKGNGLVWYARPQLFFICTLCPTGAKESLYSASHKEVSLVYFSTFEPIALTPDSIMQQAGVPMLYDSASNPRLPCLYICPVANVLGRAPRMVSITEAERIRCERISESRIKAGETRKRRSEAAAAAVGAVEGGGGARQ